MLLLCCQCGAPPESLVVIYLGSDHTEVGVLVSFGIISRLESGKIVIVEIQLEPQMGDLYIYLNFHGTHPSLIPVLGLRY